MFTKGTKKGNLSNEIPWVLVPVGTGVTPFISITRADGKGRVCHMGQATDILK